MTDDKNLTVSYESDCDCVVCRFSGILDRDAALDASRQAVDIVHDSGCTKILIDIRDARIEVSIIDMYKAPKLLISMNQNHEWRRALLTNSITENLHFFETVAKNRGLILKAFTDKKEAVDWLHSR